MGKKIEGGPVHRMGRGDHDLGCDVVEALVNGATFPEAAAMMGVSHARTHHLAMVTGLCHVLGVSVMHRGTGLDESRRYQRARLQLAWKRLGLKVEDDFERERRLEAEARHAAWEADFKARFHR